MVGTCVKVGNVGCTKFGVDDSYEDEERELKAEDEDIIGASISHLMAGSLDLVIKSFLILDARTAAAMKQPIPIIKPTIAAYKTKFIYGTQRRNIGINKKNKDPLNILDKSCILFISSSSLRGGASTILFSKSVIFIHCFLSIIIA